jgi:hypothetical protein
MTSNTGVKREYFPSPIVVMKRREIEQTNTLECCAPRISNARRRLLSIVRASAVSPNLPLSQNSPTVSDVSRIMPTRRKVKNGVPSWFKLSRHVLCQLCAARQAANYKAGAKRDAVVGKSAFSSSLSLSLSFLMQLAKECFPSLG